MSAATAGILGALAGLGVVFIMAGLRRTAAPEPSPSLAQLAARVRQEATMPRVATTLVLAAVVVAVTRWPSGTVLAGLAAIAAGLAPSRTSLADALDFLTRSKPALARSRNSSRTGRAESVLIPRPLSGF